MSEGKWQKCARCRITWPPDNMREVITTHELSVGGQLETLHRWFCVDKLRCREWYVKLWEKECADLLAWPPLAPKP